MRLAAALLACAAATAAEPAIARWGNLLIVTAPAETAAAPAGILRQRMTVDFADTPVAEVAEVVRRATGLNVVVAPAVLAADRRVTLRVTDMELGNLLRWVGTQAGVHVGWLHGALYLGDAPVAGAGATRVYDVSDLTLPLRDFPGPEPALSAQPKGGGFICFPQEDARGTPTAADIEDLLRKHVTR